MTTGYTKIPACRIAPDWLLEPKNAKERKEARITLAKDAWLWVNGMLAGAKPPKVQAENCYIEGTEKTYQAKTLQTGYRNSTVTVCALGALFVADIVRNNRFDSKDDALGVISERLGRAFNDDSRDRIEGVFEDVAMRRKFSKQALQLLPDYEQEWLRGLTGLDLLEYLDGYSAKTKTESVRRRKLRDKITKLRLLAILENIIHNGDFKPGKGLAPRYEPVLQELV